MKNDINIIKNELIEELNEQKAKRQKDKQKENEKEVKRLIERYVYATIKANLKNNETLESIYEDRNYIIEKIASAIYNEYIIIDDDVLTKRPRQIKVSKYNIDYDIIEKLTRQDFLKQYKQFKSELKEQDKIITALQNIDHNIIKIPLSIKLLVISKILQRLIK